MDDDRDLNRPGISRATFLMRTLGAAAAAGGLAAAGACGDGREALGPADTDASAFPPTPPTSPPPRGVLAFFDTEEAEAVEAVTARIIPGSAADPGAREAGVPTYIDNKLARFPSFAQPTYHEGPWARFVDDPNPPVRPTGDEIRVAKRHQDRYGFQSKLTPQEAYRAGLEALDAWSRRRFGGRFADLPEDRQDLLLEDLEADRASSFTDPGAAAFFAMLQQDTVEGMFADPVYGGNRDFAGWRLIGYPGAQRAYTPQELRRGTNRRPQGLKQLSATHPGHPDQDAVLPVQSDPRRG